MSESDVRRGPGWWMDLDGQWNPPEIWPEAEPPLPGWRRGDDGRWQPPMTDGDEAVEGEPGEPDQRRPDRPRITVATREIEQSRLPPLPIGPPLGLAVRSALISGLVALVVALTAIVVVTFL